MKKKILIPTDFSKNAWNAITYAGDLFKKQECVFYLVHAYNIINYTIGDSTAIEPGSPSYEKSSVASQEGLERIIEMLKYRETGNKHTYKTVSRYGDPLSVMQSLIEQKDIELVIMGTKGESDSSNALFGNNTITAMENIRNCPVMSVPQEVHHVKVSEIVFPTSYKTHYKRRELLHLVKFAKQQEATICVLHIDQNHKLSKNQEEKKLLLEDCLEGAAYSFHHLENTNVNKGVRDFVESRDSSMVAIINRKHGLFEQLFLSPMVKEFGMLHKVPLLVMHDLRN